MSKKDTNTLLLIGAGALAAYLLIPKVKEAVSGMVPSLGLPSIDLGGLLPEGGVDLSGLYDAIREGLGGITFSLVGEGGAAAAIEDIPGIPDVPDDIPEGGWWDYLKGEAVTVAKYGLIVGATGVTIRYAGPPVARATGSMAERIASRLFGTKAAQTTARVGTAGEELGPAAATKNLGKLKYPKAPFLTAAFTLSLPDLLTETIALFTGKQTLHYGDPGWNVHKTWLGGMGPAFGVYDPGYFSAGRQPLPWAPFGASLGSLNLPSFLSTWAQSYYAGGYTHATPQQQLYYNLAREGGAGSWGESAFEDEYKRSGGGEGGGGGGGGSRDQDQDGIPDDIDPYPTIA